MEKLLFAERKIALTEMPLIYRGEDTNEEFERKNDGYCGADRAAVFRNLIRHQLF